MESAAGFRQVIHTVKVVWCTGAAHNQPPMPDKAGQNLETDARVKLYIYCSFARHRLAS